MGMIPFLPRSTKARLALAGGLTVIYILVSAYYMGYGSSAFPRLTTKPDDLGHHTETLADSQSPESTNTVPVPPETPAPAPPAEARILLVSAFFPLNTSKTTPEGYDLWLTNFLGTVETEIYMFTPPEEAARVRALRTTGAPLFLDTNFTSIFDIPPLKDKLPAYTRMRVRDRDRPRHSIESYAVLNAKPYFLAAAISARAAQGAAYVYAFWSDATAFHRPHAYRTWPSPARVDELWAASAEATGTASDELLFMPIWGLPNPSIVYWTPAMGPLDARFTEGSLFGGTPAAAQWWARAFYTHHDQFLSEEIFIGKDQSIANALALLYAPRVLTVWYNDPEAPEHIALARGPDKSALGQCDSAWFYYQFFVADAETRAAMRTQWIAVASKWRWWGWWNARDTEPCRVTRVLGMEAVLKRQFGQTWRAPQSDVGVPEKIDWTIETL